MNGNRVEFSFSDAFTIEIFSNDTGDNVTDRQNQILVLIKENRNISTREIAEYLNVSRRTVLRDIEEMKNSNKINRIGKEKGGHWEVIKG